PFAESLVRQTVGVRSDKPLKVSQREIEQIIEDRKDQKINHEREEPLPSDSPGQMAKPCREPGEQEQAQYDHLPFQADPPQHVAALVVLQGLDRRLGNLDRASGRLQWRPFLIGLATVEVSGQEQSQPDGNCQYQEPHLNLDVTAVGVGYLLFIESGGFGQAILRTTQNMHGNRD